jgi:proteasome lid subunit RPN8/RPN11
MAPPISDPSQRTPSICRPKAASSVVLRLADWQALSTHATESYPSESVGILSGYIGSPTEGYYRLVNRQSGRAFEACPDSLSHALAAIEDAGSVPLLLCHSHPDGFAKLSREDVHGLRDWPALTAVIAVSQSGILDFRAFSIDTERVIRNIPITLSKD